MTEIDHRPRAGVSGQLSSLADLRPAPVGQPSVPTMTSLPTGAPPASGDSRASPASVDGRASAAHGQPERAAPTDGPIALYGGAGGPAAPQPTKPRKPVRVPTLSRMKRKGTRISAVTCYDATFARLVDEAGIDVVLVGDSLGNVVQGQESTLPVTLDDVLYHTRAVRRGLLRAHLVADLPFMTYYNPAVALPNAARLMAEGGAHAVKLEGGVDAAPVISALVASGIPVMGHIGLTPQSVHAMGGHRVQGRGHAERERILRDAHAVQAAGAYAVVLEGIPSRLAAEITAELTIPTIGIGAGVGCDGQILVLYDMLGLNPGFTPKFLKRFAELGAATRDALARYADEVQAGTFPTEAHSYSDPTLERDPPLKAVP